MRGWVRRATAASAALLATAVAIPAASADDGLDVRSTNRFVVDAKASSVQARITVSLANRTPNVSTAYGYRYFFWESINLTIPAGAERLSATSGGQHLSVSTSSTKDPSTRVAKVQLPSRLLYGQHRTLVVTYLIPGEPPRSTDRTRVGPGYASFQVSGYGDAGHTKVEVIAPKGMEWDSTTDGFSATVTGANRTLVATANNEPQGFWAIVSLRDSSRSDVHKVAVGKATFTVKAWPDDQAWGTFVADRLNRGLPVLERLVGKPWPSGLLTIREDTSVTVRGYDGWFDTSDKEIVVGERLDSNLLFHEMSHAWASGTTIKDRWLYEGLAENLADRTRSALGAPAPARHSVTPRTSGHVPLDTWTETSDGRASSTDDYAYPASYQTVRTLLVGLDAKHVTAVVRGLVSNESAYDRPGAASAFRTTTRSALDLVESRGDRAATDTFSRWVLTSDDIAQLPARAKARTSYAALDQADGAWLPPDAVRTAMYEWAFPHATTLMSTALPIAKQAGAVQAAAAKAGVPVPKTVVSAYEEAAEETAVQQLATSLPQATRSITAVGAARTAASASRNPFGALGATVGGLDAKAKQATSELAAGRLDRARASATAATDAASRSTLLGLGIVLAALALLVGLAFGGRWLFGRRGRVQPQLGATATPAVTLPTQGVVAAGDVSDPMNPADPADPDDPFDPADPADPVDPVDPVDPMDAPLDPALEPANTDGFGSDCS